MMILKNLLGINLEALEPSAETVARLLAGARRHIADAEIAGVSAETRFGSAYTAIRMLADAGLNASGYRILTSKPGQHQLAIQCLPKIFGVSSSTVQVLDALRKQRNRVEYTGDLVPESAVAECLEQAKALLAIAVVKLEAR